MGLMEFCPFIACRGSAVRVRLAPLDYWVTRNNKWFVLMACS